jgi:hypothetical protein
MTTEPTALAEKIALLLREPLLDIRAYGAQPERDNDPIQLLGGKSSPVGNLALVTKELVPMINSFRTPPTRTERWWKTFTGEELEREVTYFHACEAMEARAAAGVKWVERSVALVERLRAERAAIAQDAARLTLDIAAAQAVLGPEHQAARAAPPFDSDYWARFSRRVDNLNALLSSLQLTHAQYGLADKQAQSTLDRFSEVIDVLLPLWRQRMGFELFSRQFSKRAASFAELRRAPANT